jgi:regulator of replication initiation timing
MTQDIGTSLRKIEERFQKYEAENAALRRKQASLLKERRVLWSEVKRLRREFRQ